jgi:DNA-binding NarL/FixJ family response regulator
LAGLVDLAPDCRQAASAAELLVGPWDFDVVLLDVRLEDGTMPEENVRRLVGRGWNILLFTQERRPAVLGRCLRAGARGVVGKHEDWTALADAIKVVATGVDHLTADWATAMAAVSDERVPTLAPREAEVLALYAAGLPMKSVARRVGVAEDTAKEYLHRIRRKYSGAGRPAPTKTELYVRAVEDGHLPNPADG